VPQHLRTHAWFVSYAPSSDPKIAVSVIIEHGGHGSSAAAPIARELIKCYLNPESKDSNNAGLAADYNIVYDEY